MGDVTKCAICGKDAVHVDNGTRLSLGGCCGGSRCCSVGHYPGWTTEPLPAAPAPTPDVDFSISPTSLRLALDADGIPILAAADIGALKRALGQLGLVAKRFEAVRIAAPAPTPDPRPITCAACDELPAAPAVHFDVCDAEGRREPCCGGIDCCGLTAGYARDWRIEPLVPTPGPRDAEIERLRADRDGLVATLVRVFGWSDVSCLHAALHVENAVRNLQATLATEHAETERLRGLYGWLTDEVRKLAHEGDWGHGRTHEQLLSDVRRKIDGGAAEIAALRERNAELEAALGHLSRMVRTYEIDHGLFTYDGARLNDAELLVASGTAALDAVRAEDKARSSELEAQVRTLRQAVSLIVSDIKVKHAHYEDAHLDPKPKRPIPVDEANWLRTLEHALAGDAEAIENTIEARAEIATEAALADQKTRVLDDVKAKVEGLVGWELIERSLATKSPGVGFLVGRADVLAAIDAAREGV